MATTADFKNGLCIEFNNDLFTIVEFQHVKPGKGPAFVRTKLKSLTTGKVLDNTFTSGVKVTTARIETRPHQYLYEEESGYVFMNNETFEQVTIPENLVEGAEFMKEGQEVEIMWHAETDSPLTVNLPAFVPLEVTYTEIGLKGDTATNASKPATLETGANIQVPLFVNQGDVIKVDTRTREYVERVKK
jgi:elongation factor P